MYIYIYIYGGVHSHGDTQNGWFSSGKIPIWNGWCFGGTPMTQETSICRSVMLFDIWSYWMVGNFATVHQWPTPTYQRRKRRSFAHCYTSSLYGNTKNIHFMLFPDIWNPKKKKQKRKWLRESSTMFLLFPPCLRCLFLRKIFHSETLLRFLSGRRLRSGGRACCLGCFGRFGHRLTGGCWRHMFRIRQKLKVEPFK